MASGITRRGVEFTVVDAHVGSSGAGVHAQVEGPEQRHRGSSCSSCRCSLRPCGSAAPGRRRSLRRKWRRCSCSRGRPRLRCSPPGRRTAPQWFRTRSCRCRLRRSRSRWARCRGRRRSRRPRARRHTCWRSATEGRGARRTAVVPWVGRGLPAARRGHPRRVDRPPRRLPGYWIETPITTDRGGASWVNLLAQGWRDQDDADRLRDDPAFRLAVSTRQGDAPLRPQLPNPAAHIVGGGIPDGLASQPTLSRLAANLASEHNRGVLRDSLALLAGQRVRGRDRGRRDHVTVDIDALPTEVEGASAGERVQRICPRPHLPPAHRRRRGGAGSAVSERRRRGLGTS